VTKDTERWLINGNFSFNIGYVSSEYNSNYAGVINNLKAWLNNRVSWLNGEINSRYTGTINIASAIVTLSDTLYAYDGTAKTPRTVVESYGKILTEGTHYTLTYANNTEIGDATVTITGMGDYYNGSTSASFRIAEEITYIGMSHSIPSKFNIRSLNNGTLNIESSSNVVIYLYSIKGNMVQKIDVSAGSSMIKLSVPAGIYIVKNSKTKERQRVMVR
jgi:hypothetical protein